MSINESLHLRVEEAFALFCNKVDDEILRKEQQRKASKKQTEFETKLAKEMQLNNELNEKLAEYSRRADELNRLCDNFSSFTIADRDQKRLENAKETYEVIKALTGIRFDFSAPADVAKGYIKNSSRKQLKTFELDSKQASEGRLWDLMSNCEGKENLPP